MFLHLLDGGVTMGKTITPSKGSPSKFSLAKSIVSSFTLQRMLASKTVECGLLCATGDDELKECVELRRPSAATLKLIQDLEQEGGEAANLLGGLSEAHQTLMETNQGKKFNRVLVMYTDGETPLAQSAQELKSLQRDLVQSDVLLYCLVTSDVDSQQAALSEHLLQLRAFCQEVGGQMAVVRDLAGGLKFLSSGPGLGSR